MRPVVGILGILVLVAAVPHLTSNDGALGSSTLPPFGEAVIALAMAKLAAASYTSHPPLGPRCEKVEPKKWSSAPQPA